MNDNSIDVFGRAMLYIYQAGLKNLGFEANLRAVRVVEEQESGSPGLEVSA